MTFTGRLLTCILVVDCALLLSLLLWIVICRRKFHRQTSSRQVICFFHPHCSAGGGGERVLWKAVQVIGELNTSEQQEVEVIIYTIDEPKASYKQDLLKHVQARFSISISESLPLSFVHLHVHAHFLERCSRFSLIGESWGTMKLAYKALEQATPGIFFDTTGCAFTFFVARILAGCRVAAYVHYPTISTDMLSLVWERRPSYNHNVDIARSTVTTYAKLIYYTLFAIAYGMVGSLATLVMVNSSWTYGHISFLWRGTASRIKVVFPPCDVESLQLLPLEKRERSIISIGQFRPEKDHELQIRAFSQLCKETSDVTLVLIGSCRGREDEARVRHYQSLVESLGLTDSVKFVLNQPYPVLQYWLARASVGLHTMWNEHFGIGVVEMMAAGLLVIAHNSGGPKADIVTLYKGKKTGFLATTCDEYADAMKEALGMDPATSLEIRRNARASARRFSDDVFAASFKSKLVESGLLSSWRRLEKTN